MSDSSESVRGRIDALEGEVRRLAGRVQRLEAAAALGPALERAEPPLPSPAEQVPGAHAGAAPPAQLVALGGRTILALAGAYLIRALTDAAVLSPVAGVALGLVYALLFYVLADRVA